MKNFENKEKYRFHTTLKKETFEKMLKLKDELSFRYCNDLVEYLVNKEWEDNNMEEIIKK